MGIIKLHGGAMQKACLHPAQLCIVLSFPQKLHFLLEATGFGFFPEPSVAVNRRPADSFSRKGQFNPALVAVPYGKP